MYKEKQAGDFMSVSIEASAALVSNLQIAYLDQHSYQNSSHQ
jgi:hypothetical protein